MQKKIIYFFLLLCLIPVLLMAGTKGRIKGKITDMQSGEPLIGANVIVEGTSSGSTSDVNGEFVIQNLEAGSYQLHASFIGYQTISVTNVRVSSDLTVEQNFRLPAEGISVATVTIIAPKPLVNKDNTNAIRVTTSEDIKALPIRSVAGIYSLTAGVTTLNGNVYMRGGRYDEVGYYLEGISVKNPYSGQNGVTVSPDAVEEIQVQAGGYTAEFGGANSGLVRQQLKSGTPQYKASVEYITDNLTFKSKNKAFDGDRRLGAYWYGYDELSAVLSGPLSDPRIKFFANIDYNFQRDRNPYPYTGINLGLVGDKTTGDTINFVIPAGAQPANMRQAYTYTGTVNFDFAPVLFRLSGTLTNIKSDVLRSNGTVLDFLNTRIGVNESSNGTFNAKLTNVLSPDLFYELSGGYSLMTAKTFDPYLKDNFLAYGDSVANANAGIVWARSAKDLASLTSSGRYAAPAPKVIFGYSFTGENTVQTNYSKTDYSGLTFAGNLSYLIGKTHSIKLGGEIQSYTLRTFNGISLNLASQIANARAVNPNANLDSLQRVTVLNNGGNTYGYDALGNETDGTSASDPLLLNKADAPHKPLFVSAFVQDKIEYQDLVINVGLRYDYYNVDNKMLVDPRRPELGIDKNTGQVLAAGWKDVPAFSMVSPRIGFSFPVTDKTVFHAQYGKFVQETKLRDIYSGYSRLGYELRTANFFSTPFGKYLKPTRTTQYELGFIQQLTDFMSVDITGFYKDLKDQVVFAQQAVDKTSPYKSYNTLANGDFATTKGVEITFTMRRYERLSINSSISFQDAKGTGSSTASSVGIVGAPLDGTTIYSPHVISPLDFNNALRANANFDYRFADGDGPVWLQNAGLSLLLRYSSGHPFTLGTGGTNLEGDARDRTPLEPLNSSVTPSTFTIDLRVDKTIKLLDNLSANIYVQVLNLLDRRNVENVFLRTGAPNDDGYLGDPNLSGSTIASYGSQYIPFYKAMNIDYAEKYQNAVLSGIYGAPRQIRLGIRLEY
ncbi:MAG: TonB-dependent receptor [Ignavibacteria bacterium]